MWKILTWKFNRNLALVFRVLSRICWSLQLILLNKESWLFRMNSAEVLQKTFKANFFFTGLIFLFFPLCCKLLSLHHCSCIYFCSCVYKCVCQQHSEQMYSDLIKKITNHLERVSKELQVRSCTILFSWDLAFCWE